jgi:hypothetical protein
LILPLVCGLESGEMFCANVYYHARLTVVIANIIACSVQNGEPGMEVCNYQLSDCV